MYTTIIVYKMKLATSAMLKAILSHCELIHKGTHWKLGNGS